MNNCIPIIPTQNCEPVKSYKPGSPERKEAISEYNKLMKKVVDIPMFINGKNVKSNKTKYIYPPHNHKHIVGKYYEGNKNHIMNAIDSALKAKKEWASMDFAARASIFLKAAELLRGPFRQKINAATMIGQSKNIFQAEIDASCELIDFLNFNVKFANEIYQKQPESSKGIWNKMEYRPLEGFVFAITPFNFTSIAANLCFAPALMGNTIVWKPSDSQIYSTKVIIELLKEAGLPDGVINVIYTDPVMTSNIIFKHREFAGVHFTGSTKVFKNIWKTIGNNIQLYKNYPRIVGETGGKDFILAHNSADIKEITTALIRGAFEYQGQKCSAASRAYIPSSLWKRIKNELIKELKTICVGDPEDFSNFMNAVIHEQSFDKLSKVIKKVKKNKSAEIIFGGEVDKSVGYFVQPTVIVTKKANFFTMEEELFGPILTIFIYQDKNFDKTLKLIDETSEYGLTGAVFAKNRKIINESLKYLQMSAGNFYVNDKPTGAVVSQQPFGGGRSSGTNDKAGSHLNLLRWVSPRTIKENFLPDKNYRYPFLEK
ncbi:MAG: L-glutamate gamma-semialdehyde dehydrogenase [Flavobacteriales bacterium TMED191]|nr:MAG: L-glutamate gamma-semialdehyde dehydrogenase [Flavobacteriales bacterium TMED191]|tara:strand:+ start:681 stop:2309 length:1629 start_codon:yes stop_codon:yes gene_type:complete